MNFSSPLLNLVFSINMSAYHLKKEEVSYELRIRNLPAEGNAEELRKRLSKALSSNTDIDEAAVESLVPGMELDVLEGKFQDLSALVANYEGDFSDNEFHRITARLWHVYSRVNRIPVGAGSSEVEEDKQELLAKSKELLESFESAKASFKKRSSWENATSETNHQKLISTRPPSAQYQGLPLPPESAIMTVDTESGQQREEENLLWQEKKRLQEAIQEQEELWKQRDRKLQEELKKLEERKFLLEKNASATFLRGDEERPMEDRKNNSQPRYVPVYKWGLKFDSQTQSIGAFLQRVEEIRRARGVTPDELFDSAVDLFSGPALVWYRSTIGRINTWGSLCMEMKIVFQSPDHDIRLQQEIFNRVQGEAEPIDLFIAAMEGLYGRLATSVPEDIRLRQIFHNLSPQLQDRLALFDVTSIEQLRQLGRKAEAGRFRSTIPRGPTRGGVSLEPDLAYEPSRRRTSQLASVEIPPKEVRAICWNCGGVGHRHNMCQQKKKKFCFGCGKPDVIRSNCPKCTSKSAKCTSCSKNV